jgi:hypothetical protein
MKRWSRLLTIGVLIFGMSLPIAFSREGIARAADTQNAKKADISQEELAASVPALNDLHEVVYPLWHDAFSTKDYNMIRDLLPTADSLAARLDEAKLPGILRDKQPAWDEGKANLKAALEQLHVAAESDDHEAMLKQTEAFHSAFERLVRTIRPVVPELDAFHQEMYKLYHYYAPEYDVALIRTAVVAMQDKIPALKNAQLPKRLTDRQKDFDAAVGVLEASVNDLADVVKTDNKKDILAAVERTHSAYQRTERIFD